MAKKVMALIKLQVEAEKPILPLQSGPHWGSTASISWISARPLTPGRPMMKG